MGICDLLIERNYDLNIWAYAQNRYRLKDRYLEKLKRCGIQLVSTGDRVGK